MDVLDPGLDRLRQQLVEEVRASEVRTGRRVEALGARIDTVEAGLIDLRHRVDATAAETRRHFDVAAEALRSDIVVVAEGVAMLDEKTERFRDEVRGEFSMVDRRFLHLEARVISALERP